MSRPDDHPTSDPATPGPAEVETAEAAPGSTGVAPTAAEIAEVRQAEAEPVEGGLSAAVVALTADDIAPGGRRKLLARVVGEVRRSGAGRLRRPKAALRWLVDTVTDIAPYVPVRDLETLRRHHEGLSDEAIAERLIRNATLATAGVGAAGGGVASVQWVATPTLLSAPVLLAAETVAVVAIEIKLVGELQEVYGQPVTGNAAERSAALMQAWAARRGVNPLVPGVGVGTVLGTAARKELQTTLLHRFKRNLATLGPLLTGAAVASYLNRRATRTLGDQVREDLRRRVPIDGVARPPAP